MPSDVVKMQARNRRLGTQFERGERSRVIQPRVNQASRLDDMSQVDALQNRGLMEVATFVVFDRCSDPTMTVRQVGLQVAAGDRQPSRRQPAERCGLSRMVRAEHAYRKGRGTARGVVPGFVYRDAPTELGQCNRSRRARQSAADDGGVWRRPSQHGGT